jgi:hypothetical protein
MNVLTTTWRQLVRSRLLPVAVLLVAALAAVPLLLGRDAEPVATPTLPSAGTGTKVSDSLAEPVIDPAAPEQRSRRRRVLGVRKDPFKPDGLKHPKKAKKAKKAAARHATRISVTKPSTPTTTPTSSTPSGGTTVPSLPSTPVVVTPAKPKKTYPKGSLIVRFGDATSDALDRLVLRKLGALPKETTADETPLLVYTGLTKNHKKAIFLVDESLQPTGDGTCQPHPSNCETVQLSKGDTEFFDVADPDTGEITAQYELDLVDIK